MATTIQDFGESKERTVFSGTSDEDIAYAKTFWQSVQLLPPMESRLVSSHVKQRLKVAPPGHQPVNITYKGFEEPPQLQEFFARSGALQAADEAEQIKKYSNQKDKNQHLFRQQQQARVDKEKIQRKSHHKTDKMSSDDHSDDDIDAINEINEFEKRLGQGDFSRNSDSD